jgi:hypothetical protein
MSTNATGQPQELAQKRIHDHEDLGHRTSFTAWLRAQRHRSGSIGSLATDMAGDGGWPEPASLEDLHTYLDQFGSPWFVHHALDEAWKEWTS